MGGRRCCVEGCKNKAKNTAGVCYHSFPSDSALREKWLSAVRRVSWSPGKNARVCSDHFTKESYKCSVLLMEECGLAKPNYRKRLKEDAVPTVFVYTEQGQPECLPGEASKRQPNETLGIQEFHNGPRGLVPLFSDADLTTKIVLCNVDFSRDHVLSKLPNLPTRSTILTVDNLKVGIVGYVSNLVRVMGQPGVTIVINDPMESLRNESKRLRGEGCHVVFAIGGGDSNEDRTLADSLTDITAFVVKYQGRFAYPSTATEKHGLNFGQDLDYPINFTRSTDGKMAYIFASTNHFQLLSKFQMTVQVRTMSIVSAIGTPIILDLQAPEDRKTRELMDRYTKIIEPKAREVIGTTKVYIDNRKDVCQTGECNGGNLLADAAFDYFSEVAVAGAWSQINAVVVNAGSMSTSFDEKTKSGELRLEDVFQMYPYNDQYMFVTMRGTTLQNMMEYSGRRAPPYTKFLQLSGIRVKYKANPGVNESTVSSLLILCTSCRTPTYERVIGIQWYTLAMSRYLANGGDGYDFTRVPRGYKVSSNVSDDLIMRHYLKKRSPIMPMLDGRIVFESGAQALGAPYWTRAAFSSLCLVAAMTVATSA